MKLLLLLILGSPLFAIGQDSIVPAKVADSIGYEVIDFPDFEATFPGGVVELMKYITQNLTFPESEIDYGSSLSFRMGFVVDSTGELRAITFERANNVELKPLVLSFIEEMPNWIPAKHLGENVASNVHLPIIICVQ